MTIQELYQQAVQAANPSEAIALYEQIIQIDPQRQGDALLPQGYRTEPHDGSLL